MVGLIAQIGVLAAFDAVVGLTKPAWLLGTAVGLIVSVFLGFGLARAQRAPGRARGRGVGPANIITLARSTLVGAVAALIVSQAGPAVLVPVAMVALSLDWVDGRVARATGTVSTLGARFDMEVDALLVLLLSWQVSATLGPWVLLLGLARYLKLVASWAWPWLGATAPPRHWAKVVAATQGVVLVAVASGMLPLRASTAAVVVALAMLIESFATEIRWLWTHRSARQASISPWPLQALATTVAVLAVVTALMAPYSWDGAGSASWRLPIEALAYATLVLLIPVAMVRLRAAIATTFGILLGLVALLKVLDLAFKSALNRSFDPLVDWTYTNELIALVRDSTDTLISPLLLTGMATAVLALLIGLPLALRRATRAMATHQVAARRLVATAVTGWLAFALTAAAGGPAPALVTAGTTSYAVHQVTRIPGELRARAEFETDTRNDPLAAVPAKDLLAGLQGKDVLFVFVESYGRVALSDPTLSPGVDAVLDDGQAKLARAGISGRTAWFDSPTFGALSWLAHSTLQTGLWVNSQSRYDTLMASPRQSLSRTFRRAGWRSVATVPANTEDWPQGDFYDYNHLYDSRNVGYRGPRFGYPTMPDQFTLEALWRHELKAHKRRPVMAEIDLLSSHAPWSRTPRMVDPRSIGDGSVFDGMPDQLPSEPEIWQSRDRIKKAYGESIQYSLTALFDFLARRADDNTVVVMLGDHQPATVVSGSDADHEVPVTVLAKDPAVLEQIDSWGWQDGLRPSDSAPVWRMDAFRDAFLRAFASHGAG